MKRCIAILVLALAVAAEAAPDDVAYQWQPVRLGAGGFVTGFVTHPKDSRVRYCRTDVGNAYRWDGQAWQPMVVRQMGGGMPEDLAATPAITGVDSIALDPNDPRIVYLSLSATRSDMLKPQYPSLKGNVYRSEDGGATFAAGGLALDMEANGRWRTEGERLKVDPANGAVLGYGSAKNGLWLSLDRGKTWRPVRGEGSPGAKANVLAVHFAAQEGVGEIDGAKRSRVVYAVGAAGSVFASEDGGATWKNLSAGTELDGKCGFSTLDPAGVLNVTASGSPNVWQWKKGAWSRLHVELQWARPPHAIAFDPGNPSRVYAISDGGGVGRSLDGGATWKDLGPDLQFANAFGWLPQPKGWRSNAGICCDAAGTLWIPQGNEGVLSCRPTDREDASHPLLWKIDSRGIEEFVTHDVILPPKGDAVFAVEDATGLVSADADKFVARQIPLQSQLISNGTGLAWCPNAPEFVAIVSADVNLTGHGKSCSGYSADGGKRWNPFAGVPADPANPKAPEPAGSIAISRRDGWTTGGDHLVWLPTGKLPAHYSHDGGRTWNAGAGLPPGNGYWQFALKQRALAADPFVADKFYLVGSWAGGFFVTTDGGKSWQKQEQAGLPQFNHHGQLATNRAVRDDLWFCDGWEGASRHGLWHSTDGGLGFAMIPGIEYALTLAAGAPRGGSGDAPFSIYFYGKRAAEPAWGVFRSTDSGRTWQRIADYPTGIFDQPTCMAASWDEFGKVIVGFGGNSFVVGKPRQP